MTERNLYETQARTAKAMRLAAIARTQRLTASQVAHSAEVRESLLRASQTRTASVDTWAMVVTMLAEGEK